jgi:hypothetical protein
MFLKISQSFVKKSNKICPEKIKKKKPPTFAKSKIEKKVDYLSNIYE